ncbi:MAG: hypothetical protein FWC81_03600 [Coriobacteriia bacterium]|nr:hypothetical protein [Coriobacteriia bacterium]
MSLRRIKHPELYQDLKQSNYFEGWYFKFQNNADDVLAVILGVSKSAEGDFAFIQVINSYNNTATYTKYDIEEFRHSEDPWSIRIADNYFSFDRVELNIHADDIELVGTITISKTTPISTSLYAPNIMGPFAYLNFMECYHAVLSMHHNLNGQLCLNGHRIDFTGGCGYIEKDWGRSFPREYIWIHGQNVPSGNTLFFSLARIPFAGTEFDGLIAVLYANGIQHRFASYDLAQVTLLAADGNDYLLEVSQGKKVLKLRLQMNNSHPLLSPQLGTMSGTIKESLDSICEVQLMQGSKTLEHITFKPALAEMEWNSFIYT